MPAPEPTNVPETGVDPLKTENVEVVESAAKVEQPPSTKEVRKGRKRKSQVRFSPSPTREETAHHADVEDNITITETPPTGRKRTVRLSKMSDVTNKTSPVKNKLTPELQPVKRGEDKSNKRKRRESLGNQSSDGASEAVEVLGDKKKAKPDTSLKAGRVGGVRHPPAVKEGTPAKSTSIKLSKPQTDDSLKTKSNVKLHVAGENTHKAVGVNRHNTRQHHDSSPSEPEVKRAKQKEPEEGAIRSSGRRRSASRDTRSVTNSSAGEL